MNNQELIKKIDEKISLEIKKIDDLEEYYSSLVLEAFREYKVSELRFKLRKKKDKGAVADEELKALEALERKEGKMKRGDK